jgi:hypothetical protein
MTNEIKKRGNEKPLSLLPMNFEEAVSALLNTKPPPNSIKKKGKKRKTERTK